MVKGANGEQTSTRSVIRDREWRRDRGGNGLESKSKNREVFLKSAKEKNSTSNI